MTAEQMFKELGYKRSKNINEEFFNDEIIFSNDGEDVVCCQTVHFNKDEKVVYVTYSDKYIGTNSFGLITKQLLNAINKQVEELKW